MEALFHKHHFVQTRGSGMNTQLHRKQARLLTIPWRGRMDPRGGTAPNTHNDAEVQAEVRLRKHVDAAVRVEV